MTTKDRRPRPDPLGEALRKGLPPMKEDALQKQAEVIADVGDGDDEEKD